MISPRNKRAIAGLLVLPAIGPLGVALTGGDDMPTAIRIIIGMVGALFVGLAVVS